MRNNGNYIKAKKWSKMLATDTKSIFHSGTWTSQYYQYGKLHGPHHLSLNFDYGLMNVSGHGSDDVGTYKINGIYSTETERIGLTKTYKTGTGDFRENLGHNVTIQLYWNPNHNQFEGKWYVQTAKYRGEDRFVLKIANPKHSNVNFKV